MKCNKCNKEIDNNSKYCPYCGQKINKEKQFIKGINNSTVLCLLYLLCAIGGPLLYYKSRYSNLPTTISIILSQISIIMCFASIPILFSTLNRYPKSIFAKVLLSVNGIIGAVFLIIIIVVSFILLKGIMECVTADWSGFGAIINYMKGLI